ncbi:GNAT family N-acetyltransferase [Actinotalea solisilvae]|uniref:GNAT family N-acetyltransferase n=1 Tax=Actinotalea solisilvae TaxID=2072922 RepID=UPI0027DB8E96|nr:GNAT family N-acetyltransferase [Actinotalea solisilvae]
MADLVHAAYRSEESRRGWTTESHLVGGQRVDATMVRDLVAADDGVVLVLDAPKPGAGDAAAEPAVPLLACCHVERRERTAYVGMFAVRPALQGRGLGRRMLAAAEDQARAWSLTTLELTVLDHRPELLAWYERCGFALTGVRHPFPYGDDRFGLPQRPDLALLGMTKQLDPGGTA